MLGHHGARARPPRSGRSSRGAGATASPTLTALVEQCLLADLADALRRTCSRRSDDRAALDADVAHLMAALPALARAAALRRRARHRRRPRWATVAAELVATDLRRACRPR